jgi:hypothetical protein
MIWFSNILTFSVPELFQKRVMRTKFDIYVFINIKALEFYPFGAPESPTLFLGGFVLLNLLFSV